MTTRTSAVRRPRMLEPCVVTPAARANTETMAELKIPGRGRYDDAARRERLEWLRTRTDASIDALEQMRLVPERLCSNVENAIGAVEIPVGIAGPLLFDGDAARGIVYAPLATTEGALVA